jgi:hypothetical protein
MDKPGKDGALKSMTPKNTTPPASVEVYIRLRPLIFSK